MFHNLNSYPSNAQSNYFNMYRTKCEPDQQWRNSPTSWSNATSNEEQPNSVTSGSNTATPTSSSNNNTTTNSSTSSQLASGNQSNTPNNNSFAFSNAQGLPSKLQVSI